MARGSKKKYTSKQKRKGHDIEKGYKQRGISSKEAERRAWATVNKSDRGGRKKGGGGRGKKRSKSSSDGDQITANGHGNFVLIWPVSFVQPWLPLCRELCASFSINTQSFPFAVQLWPLF